MPAPAVGYHQHGRRDHRHGMGASDARPARLDGDSVRHGREQSSRLAGKPAGGTVTPELSWGVYRKSRPTRTMWAGARLHRQRELNCPARWIGDGGYVRQSARPRRRVATCRVTSRSTETESSCASPIRQRRTSTTAATACTTASTRTCSSIRNSSAAAGARLQHA